MREHIVCKKLRRCFLHYFILLIEQHVNPQHVVASTAAHNIAHITRCTWIYRDLYSMQFHYGIFYSIELQWRNLTAACNFLFSLLLLIFFFRKFHFNKIILFNQRNPSCDENTYEFYHVHACKNFHLYDKKKIRKLYSRYYVCECKSFDLTQLSLLLIFIYIWCSLF